MRLKHGLALFLAVVLGAVMFLVSAPGRVVAEPGSRDLTWGVSGDDVTAAQQRLQAWGYYNGPIDGVYGQEFYRAVTDFQQKNGLAVDGDVGPETWAAIGYYYTGYAGAEATRGNPAATGGSDNDFWILAKAVYGEARGEPFEGQVAVAAVILNRTRSPNFPNTVAGVVFEPGAFTAVSDGQYYMEPDSSSQKAAQLALNGWDPTNGCLYYWNPATATSTWIWSRPVVLTIGKHYFAR